MTEKVGFLLDGEHYDTQEVERIERDRRLMLWIGQESFNNWRHEVGQIMADPVDVTPRAVDKDGGEDAVLGEMAAALVDHVVSDPMKGFEESKELGVGSASAAGYGVLAVEFDRDEGPWGELTFDAPDPRTILWDWQAKGIHRYGCRWVIRKRRAKRSWAKQQPDWNKSAVEKIRPDSGQNLIGDLPTIETVPGGGIRLNWSNVPNSEPTDDDEFTYFEIWERRPDETVERVSPGSDLPEGERYMRCFTCGSRSLTQDQLGHKLPDAEICPACVKQGRMGVLRDRIDQMDSVEVMYAYPNGRKTIIAPYSGCDEILCEKSWGKIRSYPFAIFRRFLHPFKPYGPDLTTLNYRNQQATDFLMTQALTRLASSAPKWFLPDGNIVVNSVGDRAEMTDEEGDVLYWTTESRPDVQMIEGVGIPAAWSAVVNFARNALTGPMGMADFGLSPGQSRNIPAASVGMQIQQQEIPIEHYKRSVRRELGLFFGVVYDLIRQTYPAEKLARLNLGGEDVVQALDAADLPNYDFVLMAAPDMKAIDQTKAQAMQTLIQAAQNQPEWVDEIATSMGFPPSVLARVKRKMQEIRDRQAQQAQPPPGPQPPQYEGPRSSQDVVGQFLKSMPGTVLPQ